MFRLMYPLCLLDTAGDDAERMTGRGKCTWLGLRVGLGRLPSVCGLVERGSLHGVRSCCVSSLGRAGGGGGDCRR